VIVGTLVPSGSLGTQSFIWVSQNSEAVQSASAMHVPAALQSIVAEHEPERHTVPWFIVVQGPSPSAYPQSSSLVSQTALTQTAVPAAAEHFPVNAGM
jgi:hypothetical protein